MLLTILIPIISLISFFLGLSASKFFTSTLPSPPPLPRITAPPVLADSQIWSPPSWLWPVLLVLALVLGVGLGWLLWVAPTVALPATPSLSSDQLDHGSDASESWFAWSPLPSSPVTPFKYSFCGFPSDASADSNGSPTKAYSTASGRYTGRRLAPVLATPPPPLALSWYYPASPTPRSQTSGPAPAASPLGHRASSSSSAALVLPAAAAAPPPPGRGSSATANTTSGAGSRFGFGSGSRGSRSGSGSVAAAPLSSCGHSRCSACGPSRSRIPAPSSANSGVTGRTLGRRSMSVYDFRGSQSWR